MKLYISAILFATNAVSVFVMPAVHQRTCTLSTYVISTVVAKNFDVNESYNLSNVAWPIPQHDL